MIVADRVLRLTSAAALLASSASAHAGAAPEPQRQPQYVLISFDSAHDLAQWQRSRSLAARTGARFTYFLSCVYLLSPQTKRLYQAPGKGEGKSQIGFGQSREEVADRLSQIRQAHAEGHEIASHGCGHFDGANWTKAQWKEEFAQFSRIMADAYEINGIAPEPADWKEIADGVTGFRAPYLSTSLSLYKALAEDGFRYDASGVSRGPVEPEDGPDGVTRFSLPQIPEGPKARRVIAMDYNLYVRHSGGFERPDEAAAFQARSHDAFRAAFDAEHEGERRPLQIGFHFTLMNDGAYWKALESFAAEVCVMPDVVCTSYRDYLDRTRAAPDAPAGG